MSARLATGTRGGDPGAGRGNLSAARENCMAAVMDEKNLIDQKNLDIYGNEPILGRDRSPSSRSS